MPVKIPQDMFRFMSGMAWWQGKTFKMTGIHNHGERLGEVTKQGGRIQVHGIIGFLTLYG